MSLWFCILFLQPLHVLEVLFFSVIIGSGRSEPSLQPWNPSDGQQRCVPSDLLLPHIQQGCQEGRGMCELSLWRRLSGICFDVFLILYPV